ncbi:hypothetical protein APA_1286 [Pseudanabaena sp. lw0831]|nr:hypothetical protein APA_1286 [Pseudanabaena sp. lw0831]
MILLLICTITQDIFEISIKTQSRVAVRIATTLLWVLAKGGAKRRLLLFGI